MSTKVLNWLILAFCLVMLAVMIFFRPVLTTTDSRETIYKDTAGVVMITIGGRVAWVVFVSNHGKAAPIEADHCMAVPKCEQFVDGLVKDNKYTRVEVAPIETVPPDEKGPPPGLDGPDNQKTPESNDPDNT